MLNILCLAVSMTVAIALHRHTAGQASHARPGFADAAAICVITILYSLLLLSTSRPMLSLVVCALCAAGLWACNQAKKKALRGEPLVFSDVALLVQVFHFPTLYFPFLPIGKMALGFTVGICAGGLLWKYEPAQPLSLAWLVVLLLLVIFYALLKSPYGKYTVEWLMDVYPLTFDPRQDAKNYGPLGAALLHFCWHLTLRNLRSAAITDTPSTPPSSLSWPRAVLCAPLNSPLPDIFLVQAESFYDPRGAQHVPADILKNYDAICAESVHGTMGVSAFGAYTMRTEFSVLTGLAPQALGSDAFNPYLAASSFPLWSLARFFKEKGYRTLCVHPFDSHFFMRHKVMPHMGFENFLWQQDFLHAPLFGPHVADAAVAQAMLQALGNDKADSTAPLFCFAITMEAHGPWRGTRFTDDQCLSIPSLPKELPTDEKRYLAHLYHADDMIARLCSVLRQRQRPSVLGWYGDHAPGLPRLVRKKNYGTPYFVWRSDSPSPCQQDILPEHLGGALLTAAQGHIGCQN